MMKMQKILGAAVLGAGMASLAPVAAAADLGRFELPFDPRIELPEQEPNTLCSKIRFTNPSIQSAWYAACTGSIDMPAPSVGGPIPFFVEGTTVTVPVPPVSTPPIPPQSIGTPAIDVPKTCLLGLACFGPINIDKNEYGTTPALGSIPVSPAMSVTISVSDIEGEIDPATDHYTIPPLVVNVPNPFGPPIPVEVCPSGCAVPISATAGEAEPTTVGFRIQVGNTVIEQEVVAGPRADHTDVNLGVVEVGY